MNRYEKFDLILALNKDNDVLYKAIVIIQRNKEIQQEEMDKGIGLTINREIVSNLEFTEEILLKTITVNKDIMKDYFEEIFALPA